MPLAAVVISAIAIKAASKYNAHINFTILGFSLALLILVLGLLLVILKTSEPKSLTAASLILALISVTYYVYLRAGDIMKNEQVPSIW